MLQPARALQPLLIGHGLYAAAQALQIRSTQYNVCETRSPSPWIECSAEVQGVVSGLWQYLRPQRLLTPKQ